MRNTRDGEFIATAALPAAAADSNAGSFDVGALGITAEVIRLHASIPATADLVSAETVTLTPMDSADGVTFAAIEGLDPLVVTAGAGGGAADERTWPLPTGTRQYVTVNRAVSASGGDNTAVETTTELRF